MWFVNAGVVQMVDPSRLSQKALPAVTYIESVTVDRKEFAATDNLSFPRTLGTCRLITHRPPFNSSEVKFRYRLDGYDHDWHEAGTRRQAFYTDLPPGSIRSA